jgi:hypothetical protein
MKSTKFFLFWFSSFVIALILFVSCNDRKNMIPENKSVPVGKISSSLKEDTISNTTIQRESITFILGEDKGINNPYYSEATKYYQNNPEGKTDHLVTQCRSLLEVRNYLEKNVPQNKLPWGLVNLVSHGDQWLGLSVKITPDSKRSTAERLQEYLQKGTFPPLSDVLIDSCTLISVHACGIGNNPEFLQAMGEVFKSENYMPGVIAPVLFESYATYPTSNCEQESVQFLAQPYMVTFKNGEVPGLGKLCNLLHEKYPESKIDWQGALTREQPRWFGDAYHYTFDIPVNLVVNILNRDSIPDLSTEDRKLLWINQQSDITNQLKKIQLTAENFSWNIKKGYAADKMGKRVPAMLVKGYCTVFCVLEPCNKTVKEFNLNNHG